MRKRFPSPRRASPSCFQLRRDVHAQSAASGKGNDARLRPGGKIGLANWTPQGFVGRLFKIIGKYVPWRQALSRRCYGATERISRSCSARRERSLPRPEPT